jgi:hypothetical protein
LSFNVHCLHKAPLVPQIDIHVVLVVAENQVRGHLKFDGIEHQTDLLSRRRNSTLLLPIIISDCEAPDQRAEVFSHAVNRCPFQALLLVYKIKPEALESLVSIWIP